MYRTHVYVAPGAVNVVTSCIRSSPVWGPDTIGPPSDAVTVYGQKLFIGRGRDSSVSTIMNDDCLFWVKIRAFIEEERFEFEVKCTCSEVYRTSESQINWLVHEMKYRLSYGEGYACMSQYFGI